MPAHGLTPFLIVRDLDYIFPLTSKGISMHGNTVWTSDEYILLSSYPHDEDRRDLQTRIGSTSTNTDVKTKILFHDTTMFSFVVISSFSVTMLFCVFAKTTMFFRDTMILSMVFSFLSHETLSVCLLRPRCFSVTPRYSLRGNFLTQSHDVLSACLLRPRCSFRDTTMFSPM